MVISSLDCLCVQGMVPAMTASVESMLGRWEHHDGKEINAYEEFRFLTAEVISRTAFGSSYIEGNLFDKLSDNSNFFEKLFHSSLSWFRVIKAPIHLFLFHKA